MHRKLCKYIKAMKCTENCAIIYEIAARFHVTSPFAGLLKKQHSQNTPRAVHGDEWLISGGLGDKFAQIKFGFPF